MNMTPKNDDIEGYTMAYDPCEFMAPDCLGDSLTGAGETVMFAGCSCFLIVVSVCNNINTDGVNSKTVQQEVTQWSSSETRLT